MILTTATIILAISYAVLMYNWYKWWERIPEFDAGKSNMRVSVIIPAKDEEAALADCIRSVLAQDHRNLEILIVDDHSADKTSEIANSFAPQGVRLLRMADVKSQEGEVAYKKRAIEEGVRQSTGELIVTTDADCIHPSSWITAVVAAFEQSDSVMMTGPVLFQHDDSFFQRFQALDYSGMIGITGASVQMGMHNLANGANLAFLKSAFNDVDGYAGIDHKASGDDMLLIYKIARAFSGRVGFVKSKEAVVYTRPAYDLTEFFHQRLRWTSKSFSYQDRRITFILAAIYLLNVLLLVNLASYLMHPASISLIRLVLQAALMMLADYFFLRKMTHYFDCGDLMRSFLPSQLTHVLYIVIIGLAGNIIPYKWKGRKLR